MNNGSSMENTIRKIKKIKVNSSDSDKINVWDFHIKEMIRFGTIKDTAFSQTTNSCISAQ